MVSTYIIDPTETTSTERDIWTARLLREIVEKEGVRYEKLPWSIPPEFDQMDEQVYNIIHKDSNLEEKLSKGNFIVLNTTGYAHSRTYFFQKALEDSKRIHYAFDAHPDLWSAIPGLVSFGGFTQDLLELPGVEASYLVGITPNENLIPEYQEKKQIKSVLCKVKMMFSEPLSALNSDAEAWMKPTYEKIRSTLPQAKENGINTLKPKVDLTDLPGYITIDLDVIDGFPSEWRGHGRLTSGHIVRGIKLISEQRQILGADICGIDVNHKLSKKNTDEFLEIYHTLADVMK